MNRRWWIASGVLLGVLALVAFVLTRAADPAVYETAEVFTRVDYGPDAWAPGPAVVLGGLLVVAGLLVAVAAVAYALGRRHASAGSSAAAAVSESEPDVEPDAEAAADAEPTAGAAEAAAETQPAERPHGTRGWTLPVALSLSLALVTGGLVLVVTDSSSGYTLTNGFNGIAPLDNVAAIPDGAVISSYGSIVVVGEIPEVAGLPYDLAVVTLEYAGFLALDVRDRDGGPVPDGVAPGRVVDRVSPEPGTSPPTEVPVVVYLR